jgi:hypothetical protein
MMYSTVFMVPGMESEKDVIVRCVGRMTEIDSIFALWNEWFLEEFELGRE